jgi:uncharacterized membrane protein
MTTLLATSVQVPGDLSFYNVVIFIHIAAAIVGFGPIFAYPVFYRVGMAREPRGLPLFHRVQQFIGTRLITGGLAVVLATGIYQVLAGVWEFSDTFVSVGFVVVIVLGALGGVYFPRKEARLQELAERDVAAAGSGKVALSREYVDLARQVELMTFLSAGLVLVALLFMVFKPGV